MTTVKERIAQRAAEELKGSMIVNLGIGIPTLVAKYVTSDSVFFHTENGLLGVNELTDEQRFDPLRVNAGKLPVDERIGSSYFDSAYSFGMIRGGHVDVAILGALQVDENGLVANWAIPGKNIMGVGGAMDLLNGAKKVIITTNHTNKLGEPKLVSSCSYPITSNRKANLIITELGVFEQKDNQLYLVELMNGSSLEDIKRNTKAHYEISDFLKKGDGH